MVQRGALGQRYLAGGWLLLLGDGRFGREVVYVPLCDEVEE
jgi:hypothetical protein